MSLGNRYFTTHEVAKLLGVSAPTVIKWVTQGKLAAHKTPGGHRRIGMDALEQFAAQFKYPLTSEGADAIRAKGTLKVLVIDTEPDFSEMVAEYLEIQKGFEVCTGGDALQVGYFAGRLNPDVVVYDIDATTIDVRRLMKMVRAVNADCRLILTTSIWSDMVDTLRADLSADEVLQKPLKLDVLARLISQ
jgi:excisionase family DNA binding protein